MNSKILEFLWGISFWEKERLKSGARKKRENLHNSDSLLDCLAGETGAEAMVTGRTSLGWECSAVHTSCQLSKPKHMPGSWRWTWVGQWTSSFVLSPNVATLNSSSFSAFHYYVPMVMGGQAQLGRAARAWTLTLVGPGCGPVLCHWLRNIHPCSCLLMQWTYISIGPSALQNGFFLF